jgi:MOSC domain-containing protein YiiM
MFKGNVVSLHLARNAAMPMESTLEVKAIAGLGLEGDRYSLGLGEWSKTPGVGREITLIEIETIEALEREGSITIAPGAARRNVVTRGVPLNHLVGREFQVGAVRLRGMRLCEPCAYLESITRRGLIAALVHRGGLRAEIATSGTIRVEDAITE